MILATTRDDFLAQRAAELGCELLARPQSVLAGRCFTDARWMSTKDMLHPLDGYGRLVIDEMTAALG
jgi:hypothetical protein